MNLCKHERLRQHVIKEQKGDGQSRQISFAT